MEYTEDQLTGWFDIEKQKPWENGVYRVKFRSVSGGVKQAASYYDGSRFNFLSWAEHGYSIATAFNERKVRGGGDRVFSWRGLNHNPAKPSPKRNKRKTMYVVMLDTKPIASFNTRQECKDYMRRGNIWWATIQKIRFRSLEA